MSGEATVLQGDALSILGSLGPGSVQCCVTSPPYLGLRDYGVEGQIGAERTPGEYVAHLVEVFREVRRVLRDDGTLWLSLGDSYANDGKWGASTGGKHVAALHGTPVGRARRRTGLKAKDLIGIPWRVAFALQEDGWYLRSDIIWHKPNAMPSSVQDRPTTAHEYLFLLTKRPRYFYDTDAIAEPLNHPDGPWGGRNPRPGIDAKGGGQAKHEAFDGYLAKGTRNKRSVWSVSTRGYKGAHFAVFPEKLIEPCILAGTSEMGCCPQCGAPWTRVKERTDEPDISAKGSRFDTGKTGVNGMGRVQQGERFRTITTGWIPSCRCAADTAPVPCGVLDPFAGSGTTLQVALDHGRRAVGIELNPDFVLLIEERLRHRVKPKPAKAQSKKSDIPDGQLALDLYPLADEEGVA